VTYSPSDPVPASSGPRLPAVRDYCVGTGAEAAKRLEDLYQRLLCGKVAITQRVAVDQRLVVSARQCREGVELALFAHPFRVRPEAHPADLEDMLLAVRLLDDRPHNRLEVEHDETVRIRPPLGLRLLRPGLGRGDDPIADDRDPSTGRVDHAFDVDRAQIWDLRA
jgi:hypothetical protein